MNDRNKKYVERVKELAQHLLKLAEEPNPGLASWVQTWGKTFGELSDLWTQGAPEAGKHRLNHYQEVSVSNIINALQDNAHLQWGAVESGEEGIVVVGRLQNGNVQAYAADTFVRRDYSIDGQPLKPYCCRHCGSPIEENRDGTWSHVNEPHHSHPAELDKEN